MKKPKLQMYFSDTEVGNYYSVSRYTIWRWVREGQHAWPEIPKQSLSAKKPCWRCLISPAVVSLPCRLPTETFFFVENRLRKAIKNNNL